MKVDSAPGLRSAPRPGGPAPLTRFVGREREIRQVTDALREARLVSLTGPAGIGKSRLALETAAVLAAELPGEVELVSLGPGRGPEPLAPAVCSALGAPETAVHTAADALAERFGDRPSVLVLDDLDQAEDAARRVADLLARCPGLRVLASLRAPLGVSAERVVRVPPLELPEPGTTVTSADLELYAATTLFLDRASAAAPELTVTEELAPVVVEVCRLLDGLPLAIELAAARVGDLGPQALLARLEVVVRAPGSGPGPVPAEDRTLRKVATWSHELLDEREQALFRRLAVFAGGFGADAAAAGIGLPPGEAAAGLEALVDGGLLRREAPAGEPARERYQMLGPVRELAAERLAASGEGAQAEAAHLRFYVGLAEAAEEGLAGPGRAAWLDALGADYGNLRGALETAVREQDTPAALALGAVLWRFCLARGRLREGRDWLERLAALPEAPRHGRLLARVLHGLGALAHVLGDETGALSRLEASLALYRELEDREGLVAQLDALARVATEVQELGRARELSEEALRLHRELGDPHGEALALDHLGRAAIHRADYGEARKLLTRCVALRREHDDRRGTAFALAYLAWAEERTGRFDAAEERLREAEELLDEVDDRRLPAWTLGVRGLLAHDRGDLDEAVEVLGRACAAWRASGYVTGLAFALSVRAQALLELGRPGEADATAGEAEAVAARARGRWGTASARLARTRVLLARGEVEEAVTRGRDALTAFHRVGDRRGVVETLEVLAMAAARRGHRELGARLLGAATAQRQAIEAPPRTPGPEEAELELTGDLVAALEAGRELTLDQAYLLATEHAEA